MGNNLLKLAAPAQRALADAGITSLSRFANLNEGEIKQLYGVGPNTLKQLKLAMNKKGVTFKR
jgi:hypothetical protein